MSSPSSRSLPPSASTPTPPTTRRVRRAAAAPVTLMRVVAGTPSSQSVALHRRSQTRRTATVWPVGGVASSLRLSPPRRRGTLVAELEFVAAELGQLGHTEAGLERD